MKRNVKENPPEREPVVYTGANGVKINALADVDTVWLNRHQLATLFGRDVKTIGKHIANALKEELQGMSTVAKFATVQTEGGRTVTRMKAILMHRAHYARFLKELERRLADHEGRISDAERVIKYVVNTLMPPVTNKNPIGFHP